MLSRRPLRLAHGWTLVPGPCLSAALVRDFIRPAVRAVPSSLARRLGICRIALPAEVPPAGAASRWTITPTGMDVEVATAEVDAHDIAMELLLCLGQALWERLSDGELRSYWMLLSDETGCGVAGEIDQRALEAKRRLLQSPFSARSVLRLTAYGRASFAGTAAEYIHSLWHEVTVRIGPDHLPPAPLRRRLELLARWFPPDRGYRLFPAGRRRAGF